MLALHSAGPVTHASCRSSATSRQRGSRVAPSAAQQRGIARHTSTWRARAPRLAPRLKSVVTRAGKEPVGETGEVAGEKKDGAAPSDDYLSEIFTLNPDK